MSYAKVDLDKILGIGAFDLSRTMAVDEHFLDDHHHQHDASLDSISFVFDASYDKERLNAYLATLLQARGDDVFRLKGIIAVSGDTRRGVLQGVRRIFEIRPADTPGGLESATVRLSSSDAGSIVPNSKPASSCLAT